MSLYRQKPIKLSHHPAKFGCQRHSRSRDILVLFFTWPYKPRDQSFVWLYGKEPLKVYHYTTKFDGDRNGGSEDIRVLVCHVIKVINDFTLGASQCMSSFDQVW